MKKLELLVVWAAVIAATTGYCSEWTIQPSTVDQLTAVIATAANSGGGTVWLEEGTYDLSAQTALVELPANVVLRAKGRRDDTVIDMLGTGHGFELTGSGATISGITFTSSTKLGTSADRSKGRFVHVITGLVENCTFRDITIGGSGSHPAGLMADGVISGCLFTNMVCKVAWLTDADKCGTVNAKGGLVTNTLFRQCNTFYAPVCSRSASTQLVDCEFTGNTSTSGSADSLYAAVYGAASLTGCLIANNIGVRTGAFNSSVVCTDCVITNNTGGNYGVNEGASATFDHCLIAHNTGGTSGVCALPVYYPVTFMNCLIVGNVGNSTAGVVSGSNGNYSYWFENCTVSGNRTVNGAVHGVAVAGCGQNYYPTKVYNCIFYGNGNAPTDQQYTGDEKHTYSSCYPEAAAGNDHGNISGDPLFTDAAAEDYRLKYTSPCLDVALDRSSKCGTLDLVGTTRPQSANGIVEAWDMGCYEMPPNSTKIEVTAVLTVSEGVVPATLEATATTVGSALTGLRYDWAVTCRTPAGTTVTEYKGLSTNVLQVGSLTSGVYSVSVTVMNDEGDEASNVCPGAYTVRPAVCYVAPKAVGTWPYDTPAKATGDLTAALTNAGTKVSLESGAYEAADFGRMPSPIGVNYVAVVGRAVEIAGAGRDATVLLMSTNAAFCVDHADAVVRSLSVVAAGQQGVSCAGSAFRITQGTVSNVVVRDSVSWGATVYVGANCLFADALVTNVTACSNNDNKPLMVAGGTAEDVTVVGCTGKECGGVSTVAPPVVAQARLRRVKVSGCTTTAGTGALSAAADSQVEDCEFSGNSASGGIVLMGGSDGSRHYLTNIRIVNNRCGSSAVASTEWTRFFGTSLLVASNSCARGVFLNGNSYEAELKSSTVTDNRSSTQVNAGISVGGNGGCSKSLVNCIFWGNHGTAGSGSADCEIASSHLSLKVLNCCWPDVETSPVSSQTVNCTPADPRLRRSGDFKYYPRMVGSCFNAGTNETWMATAKDLDGNDRIRYDRVDIGCFESPRDPGFMLMLK